jgi:PTS system nitrogen regulatory IIA component
MALGKVWHHLPGDDIVSALKSAINCTEFLSDESKDELFTKLTEREQLASTGIGNGIAIPHPREPLSLPPKSSVIVTCFFENPVAFNAIDDRPVFVFFLLISPSVKHHLHLLSRLSYCIRDSAFVDFLKGNPDASSLYSRVADFEEPLDAL